MSTMGQIKSPPKAEEHAIEHSRPKFETIGDGREKEPVRLSIKKKISQYQNKAYFFEGQVNPLALENKNLKEQIISLNKSVLMATDVLRNLLPLENDADRKLKIQMAGVEEISAMIQEDWYAMEAKISQKSQTISQQQLLLAALRDEKTALIDQYESQIASIVSEMESQVSALREKVYELTQRWQASELRAKQEKERLISEHKARLEEAEKMQKSFKLYMKEMSEKCSNYDRAIQRLKDQISSNIQEFEKSKAHLKEIYDSIMAEKLEQQKDTYEFLLRVKDEEKSELLQQIEQTMMENKKKLSQKNSEINYLSGRNDKLKEEIGQCKDEIWAKSLELESTKKEIHSLTATLEKQKQSFKDLQFQLQQQALKASAAQLSLREEVKRKSQENQQIKQELRKAVIQFQQEREIMKNQINESESKLQAAKRKVREMNEEYEEALEKERQKQRLLEQGFKEEQKALRVKLGAAEKEAERSKLQISTMKREHENMIKSVNDQHRREREQILTSHKSELRRMMQESEQNLKKVSQGYERMMTEKELENNEYVRKLILEQSIKLADQQSKYEDLKSRTENQIRSLQTSLGEKMAEMKMLSQNFENVRQRLEEERREAAEKLESEKQKILDRMKEQIDSFKKALTDKQAEYEKRFTEMQNEMNKQINMLKKNNALDSLEEKYNEMISQLKLQMDQERNGFEKQRLSLNDDKLRSIEAVKKQHLQEIESLNIGFHKELNMISQKLEFNISKLNEDLLNEKEAHEFSKLSREDKINFLLAKIQSHKNQIMEKETQIFDLEYIVEKKNKQLARIDDIVAEKLKAKVQEFEQQALRMKKDCQTEISRVQSLCRAKVKQVQFERIKFTQDLYEEFQLIKDRNLSEINSLNRKYQELEHLFQERPSRAEDLSKIKDLTEEKSKMDLEMKEFRKKVKEANDIVRYLSLELQNYKTTYDIFGPGGEPLSNERRDSVESPIKSIILSSRKIATPLQSEESEGPKNSTNWRPAQNLERRYSTEGDATQFRLFPQIKKKKSITVFEAPDEDEDEYEGPVERVARVEDSQKFYRKKEQEIQRDRTEELRSNADAFISLLSNEHRPAATLRKNIDGYGRRSSGVRTRSITYKGDRRVQIKDKTMTLNS